RCCQHSNRASDRLSLESGAGFTDECCEAICALGARRVSSVVAAGGNNLQSDSRGVCAATWENRSFGAVAATAPLGSDRAGGRSSRCDLGRRVQELPPG